MKIESERMPAIVGTGRAVGSRQITNADMDTFLGAKKAGLTQRLMEREGVGIDTRYWVEAGTGVSVLALKSLQEALKSAHLTADKIDELRVATSSPDFQAVNIASLVQYLADLRTEIHPTTNMDACPGWVLATQSAIKSLCSPWGKNQSIAVIGAEVTSAFLSPLNGVTAIIFGDGAGTAIFQNVEADSEELKFIGLASGSDGKYAKSVGIMGSGSAQPTAEGILDNGLHVLTMDGKTLKEQAIIRMPQVLEQARKDANIEHKDIDWYIFHQANRNIMEAAAASLSIPIDKCIFTIDKMGNTSAASIPTALDIAIRDGRIKRNDIVAMSTFGGGFCFGAIIMPMVGLPAA